MSDSAEFHVVWPSSPRHATHIDAVSSIGGLNGKRIAFIWDYRFRGDEMWAMCKQDLAALYPEAEFIDHEVFGDVHGANEVVVMQELGDKLRDLQVDGAVVGVGA